MMPKAAVALGCVLSLELTHNFIATFDDEMLRKTAWWTDTSEFFEMVHRVGEVRLGGMIRCRKLCLPEFTHPLHQGSLVLRSDCCLGRDLPRYS